ncbi:MAG: hypothetical protein ACLUI3_14395 [Christensenellales bacterium]
MKSFRGRYNGHGDSNSIAAQTGAHPRTTPITAKLRLMGIFPRQRDAAIRDQGLQARLRLDMASRRSLSTSTTRTAMVIPS